MAFQTIFKWSVTDESFVDETRVWRIYKILIPVSVMNLFFTNRHFILFVYYISKLCTDLEYTECSCFIHQLKPKPKSNKVLIGSIGSLIGLFMTIIFYTTWMLLNGTNHQENRIDPEKTKIFPDNQSKKKENTSGLFDKSQLPGSDIRQKKHHNCFMDHSGFDFSKIYVNKDGSKRIIKCRHQRDS